MAPADSERCAGGALLVGTGVWLPEDPRERFVASPDWIGCNRLFCSSCRSWVRHLDNVGFNFSSGPPPSSDLASLYVDANAESYPGFMCGRLSFRVYFCQCESTEIGGVKPAGMLDTIDSWACAGHPAPGADEATTPAQPANDAAVRALLRSSASSRWDFALRWRPPFLFRSVWPVVTDLLVDADPVLRARSLEFVRAWKLGTAVTFDRLIDIASNHTSLYMEPALRSQLASTLADKATEIPALSSQIAKALETLQTT